MSELGRLQQEFENLADEVLNGKVDAGVAQIAGRLLNFARQCVRDAVAAREQEELVEKVERLEEALSNYPGSYGA